MIGKIYFHFLLAAGGAVGYLLFIREMNALNEEARESDLDSSERAALIQDLRSERYDFTNERDYRRDNN